MGFRISNIAIGNITFEQLETLSIQNNMERFKTELLRLISQNRRLKNLETNIRLSSEELLALVDGLPELEEITIIWYNQLINSLEVILQGDHKLSIINIYFFSAGITVREFERITPSNWQLVENRDRNGLSFNRKH